MLSFKGEAVEMFTLRTCHRPRDRAAIAKVFVEIFTLRASRRGGDELRTSVYPSNFAPIATKLRQRAFQTICKFRFFDAEKNFSEKNSDFVFGFSSFSVDFRGARLFLTSKSSSSRFFALDGQIFRSVRRLEVIFGFFTVRTSTCEGN